MSMVLVLAIATMMLVMNVLAARESRRNAVCDVESARFCRYRSLRDICIPVDRMISVYPSTCFYTAKLC